MNDLYYDKYLKYKKKYELLKLIIGGNSSIFNNAISRLSKNSVFSNTVKMAQQMIQPNLDKAQNLVESNLKKAQKIIQPHLDKGLKKVQQISQPHIDKAKKIIQPHLDKKIKKLTNTKTTPPAIDSSANKQEDPTSNQYDETQHDETQHDETQQNKPEKIPIKYNIESTSIEHK